MLSISHVSSAVCCPYGGLSLLEAVVKPSSIATALARATLESGMNIPSGFDLVRARNKVVCELSDAELWSRVWSNGSPAAVYGGLDMKRVSVLNKEERESRLRRIKNVPLRITFLC